MTYIGDSGVGKTVLVQTYKYQKPVEPSYVPGKADDFRREVQVSGKPYVMEFKDIKTRNKTIDQSFEGIEHPDCIVLCYSVVSKESFENLEASWLPKVKEEFPSVPLLLVGLQEDARKNSETEAVSLEDAEAFREKYDLLGSFTVSALGASTPDGLKNLNTLLSNVINHCLNKTTSAENCCICM